MSFALLNDSTSGSWTSPPITGNGPLGLAISHQLRVPPSNYTIQWVVSGTPPSRATFQAEGSLDGVNWFALTAATDFTASNLLHIAYKPVLYFRVNVLTYTAGDGTTGVVFSYTRGS